MRIAAFYLCLLFVLTNCSKNETFSFNEPIIENINSAVLDRAVEIITYLPKNYSEDKSYPTVYLLDGQYFLKSGFIKNIATLLSERIEKNEIPEVILVGIGNDKNRRIDYTFPEDINDKENTGGGQLFNKFINNELIPEVDQKFSTDSSKRLLIGHSLGGYFALSTLFMDTLSQFSDIISSTPAISYFDAKILESELKNTTFSGRFFITVGGEESSVVLLNKAMVNKLKNQLNSIESKFYPKETHRSVAVISVNDGLTLIFD